MATSHASQVMFVMECLECSRAQADAELAAYGGDFRERALRTNKASRGSARARAPTAGLGWTS